MKDAVIKERVLKNIREALLELPDYPCPPTDMSEEILPCLPDYIDVVFAENFVRLGGKFVYCEGVEVLIDSMRIFCKEEGWSNIYCSDKVLQRVLQHAEIPYSSDPDNMCRAKVGIESCKFLLARTGSLVFLSGKKESQIFSMVDSLVVVATLEQLKKDMQDAYQVLKEQNRLSTNMVSLTGISALTHVSGECIPGFGPKEIFLFLVDPKA